MTLDEIRAMPTSYVDGDGQKCHESLLQSFQLLMKVEEWLDQGAPAIVVLEMMRDVRRKPYSVNVTTS